MANLLDTSCPVCEEMKFDRAFFDKHKIEEEQPFDCPVCGNLLVYADLGPYFLLHSLEDLKKEKETAEPTKAQVYDSSC